MAQAQTSYYRGMLRHHGVQNKGCMNLLVECKTLQDAQEYFEDYCDKFNADSYAIMSEHTLTVHKVEENVWH